MTVRIDRESKVPPYEQVRSQLAAQINAGTLVVGSRLPTVRRMAADLGIAANTIARAYRELEAAGLIETHGRGGCLVASTGDAAKEQARQAAANYAATVRGLGIEASEALAIVTAALDQ